MLLIHSLNYQFLLIICESSLRLLLFLKYCFFTGGKAFGLLKSQQEEKLSGINEVS